MTFFSPSLSEKLAKKGLKTDEAWWWARDTSDFELKPYGDLTTVIGDGWTWLEEAMSKGSAFPAYTFQDLLSRENAIKLWGKEAEDYTRIWVGNYNHQPEEVRTRWVAETGKVERWNVHSYRLLDLYQSSGLEAVEAELEKGLR